MTPGHLFIHFGVPQVEADSRELFMEGPSALGDLEERLAGFWSWAKAWSFGSGLSVSVSRPLRFDRDKP